MGDKTNEGAPNIWEIPEAITEVLISAALWKRVLSEWKEA